MSSQKDNRLKYKYIGFGIIISFVITLVTLLLIALVMYFANIDSIYASPLASVGLAVGCFFGGLYSSKKSGKNGLLYGFLTAGIYFILIFIASLSVSLNSIGILTLIHAAVMLLSGSIGGILGVNSKTKQLI